MNKMPLVSVVIPVFNGERFIKDAIKSVLSQSYRPLEIIVVDDGSTDKTAENIKEFPAVKYIFQDNQGVSATRNKGLEAAQGELITFLDHDDILLSDSVSRRVVYMLENPEVWCIISKHRSYLEQDFDLPPWILESEFIDGAYGFGYLMVKKDVFLKTGGFDPKYRTGELMDFFFRVNDTGQKIAKFPEITVLRRVHGKNLSKDVTAMRENLLKSAKASILRKRKMREENEQ